MPIYAALFEHLCSKAEERGFPDIWDHLIAQAEGQKSEKKEWWCDHTLRFTKEFAEMHDLCFEDLSRILGEMGGYCDCEVLLNSQFLIPPEDVIGAETFKTPVGIAIEKGLYAHCRVDGQPVSFPEAMAGKKAGQKVEMWVPCGKDDPYAMPDVLRAIACQRQSKE